MHKYKVVGWKCVTVPIAGLYDVCQVQINNPISRSWYFFSDRIPIKGSKNNYAFSESQTDVATGHT